MSLGCVLYYREGGLTRGLKLWAETTCDWTSVHGLVWYTRVDNAAIKAFCIFIAFVVIIGLPIFLAQQIANYATSTDVLNSSTDITSSFETLRKQGLNEVKIVPAVEYHTALFLPYPNITVCHPRYFSYAKLEGIVYRSTCVLIRALSLI